MVRIEFTTDSAVFDDGPEYETERVLRALAKRIGDNGMPFGRLPLYDINGNKIGFAEYSND